MVRPEGHGFDEAVEARLAGAEGLFRDEAVAAGGGLLELAFECRDETGEILFRDVVVGTGTHGVDGHLFGDGTGEHDERDIEGGRVEELEGGGAAEIGKVVVGEDDIWKIRGHERGGHLVGGLDASDDGRKTMTTEVTLEEERVVGIIFDEENAKRVRS